MPAASSSNRHGPACTANRADDPIFVCLAESMQVARKPQVAEELAALGAELPAPPPQAGKAGLQQAGKLPVSIRVVNMLTHKV